MEKSNWVTQVVIRTIKVPYAYNISEFAVKVKSFKNNPLVFEGNKFIWPFSTDEQWSQFFLIQSKLITPQLRDVSIFETSWVFPL